MARSSAVSTLGARGAKTPVKKQQTKSTEKPVAKRGRPAKEEPVTKRTRTKDEAPVAKRGRPAKDAPVKRGRPAKEVEDGEIDSTALGNGARTAKSPKRTKATEIEADCAFNPYARLDDVLDDIEKHIGLSESSMDPAESRLSTGNLILDIILGGGITSGWYTNFGQEQCCKTTGAVTILAAALNSNVPILGYWDYEGCLPYDTQIVVNGKQQHIGDLFAGLDMKPYIAFDISKLDITVDSPCGPQKAIAAMYKGPKPITRIEAGDFNLEGYRHPVLVYTQNGFLEWKYIEELSGGDLVAVRP